MIFQVYLSILLLTFGFASDCFAKFFSNFFQVLYGLVETLPVLRKLSVKRNQDSLPDQGVECTGQGTFIEKKLATLIVQI